MTTETFDSWDGRTIVCPSCNKPIGKRCKHAIRVSKEGEIRGREMGASVVAAMFVEDVRKILKRPQVSFYKLGDGRWAARTPENVKGSTLPHDTTRVLQKYGLVIHVRGATLAVTEWGREVLEALHTL